MFVELKIPQPFCLWEIGNTSRNDAVQGEAVNGVQAAKCGIERCYLKCY